MRQRRVPNDRLRALLAEAGWSGEQLTRTINRLGAEAGLSLSYQRASVTQWLSGMRPRAPVPELIVEAFSREFGRPVTLADAGLGPVVAAPEGWERDAAAALVDAPHGARPYRMAALAVPDWPDLPSRCPDERAPGPIRVSRTDVESATAMLRLFSDVDMMFGGGHARHALTGYLRSTIAPWLIAGASPTLRRELLTTAARLAYLCGFMCFDDELHGTAEHYYLTSLRLSAESGDALGYALTLRALSVQARQLGHHRPAVDLAEAAMRAVSDRASPRVRAFVLGQVAVAHAADGNGRDALRTLSEAEKLLAMADTRTSGIAVYHAASLAHQQAAVAACLGDRRNAIRALEASVRHRPANERRSRAITLARLAELQLTDGRLEQACHTWQRFLDDYPFTNCRRADTALRILRSRTRPHHNHPAARALLNRVATLPPRRTAGLYT